MVKIEKTEVFGWNAALRGMRNAKNSWDKSDTRFDKPIIYKCGIDNSMIIAPLIGENDLKLAKTLVNAGPDHSKFMRFIDVEFDITAPFYWWKEARTYRMGRSFSDTDYEPMEDEMNEFDIEMNSCSTMHKIMSKEFELSDFSTEGMENFALASLEKTIDDLNYWRNTYVYGGTFVAPDGKEITVEKGNKTVWEQVIKLLPSCYNQKRTMKMTYQTLWNINRPGRRKNHKLTEWVKFCEWVDTLPYFKELTEE